LIKSANLNPISLPCPEREVNGAYIGDLLSWVMGKANEDNAWITIMSNTNIVAVATLADVSCIILAEGVTPDEGVKDTAEAKGINLLSSSESAYAIAKRLSELGL
jgi:serine kinase of HPr protein (carbohydrate metabolism regulator)